jgi:hypothetical protein
MLEEYEAEFSIELINTIYATVTRMLPEYFQYKSSQQQADPGSHFVKTKMLEDEPNRPITGGKLNDKAMTEEDKFDQSEAFDRGFLTKKYPGLALPNVRNKEEIDIFGDLEDDAGLKREDRKLDVGKEEPKKTKKSRSRSRSRSPRDRRKRRHSSSSSRDRRHHRRDDDRTRVDDRNRRRRSSRER